MALGVVGLLAGAALVGLGCGSGSYFGPPGEGGSGSAGNGVFPSGTGASGCAEGAQQSCHVTIGTHNGVTNCLNGVEVCSGGKWGPCSQGKLAPSGEHHGPIEQEEEAELEPTIYVAPGSGVTLLNAMMSGSCDDNCDPSCQQFTENAPPGGGGTGMSACSWSESPRSALTGAMGSIMGKGYKQPCATGKDCEFDQYCSNPVTTHMPGSCAHDKCAVGAGLLGCTDACAHKVLTDLGHLGCNVVWDASCVAAVYSDCGIDCTNTTTGCAHDKCLTGGPLVNSCDNASTALSCVYAICNTAGTHHCCQGLGGSWDQACVNAVATLCPAADACPATTGTCEQWLPGMTDPNCVGKPDLTAGNVCSEMGPPAQDVIPICNVGAVTANPPITVVTYAGGAGHAPNYPPGAGVHSTITVTQPIPPGQCVDVTVPGTNNNDEIFVNPPGGSQIAECNFQNNWGIRIGGGMPPVCGNPGTCAPSMTPVPPITYTGDCSALPGTEVQWRWFAFTTTDPGSSSIDFSVQTGSMPSAMLVASADSGHQVCIPGMGGSTCPVDLVTALSTPFSFSNTITITAVLNSSGAGPSIQQWEVAYSCVDAQ